MIPLDTSVHLDAASSAAVCCSLSQLYRRLSEVLGLNDETMVLSVFIGKM